jgi:hypothetical protein
MVTQINAYNKQSLKSYSQTSTQLTFSLYYLDPPTWSPNVS